MKVARRAMRIETILTPAEIALLPQDARPQRTCVVFDILRATTSIVTGLAHGMERIVPVATLEEAEALRQAHPDFLLGGERHGDRPQGFDLGNSPQEYCHHPGRTVVSTTTNGTVALRACATAETILVGSLLNLQATADFIRQKNPSLVQIVCAGTFHQFALEDSVAAGLLALALADLGAEKDDATRALAAMVEYAGGGWIDLVRQATNAQALLRAGRSADLQWALQRDLHPSLVVVCSPEGCQRLA